MTSSNNRRDWRKTQAQRSGLQQKLDRSTDNGADLPKDRRRQRQRQRQREFVSGAHADGSTRAPALINPIWVLPAGACSPPGAPALSAGTTAGPNTGNPDGARQRTEKWMPDGAVVAGLSVGAAVAGRLPDDELQQHQQLVGGENPGVQRC
jgi:hypothetical protein